MALLAVTVTVFTFAVFFAFSTHSPGNKGYARAMIESCRGCSLNRLPDIKQFIFEDVPFYEGVEFKHIQGAPPELVLFDNNDEVVEKLPLSRLTREECNDLLVAKGFTRSTKFVKDEI